MRNLSTIRLFVILVFVVPAVAYAAMNLYEKKFQPLPVLGPVDHKIANFSLINQDGDTLSIDSWNDKIVVADFFFTHCPTVCPAMTKNLLKVQQQFGNDKEVFINSFTVDPETDNAGQLKSFSRRFGIDNNNWQLLTGDKKQIYRLARNSFMIVVTDGDGGPEDFIHSEKLVLLDKQKRIRGYYQGTNEKEVDQLINDIKKLKDEN